MYNCSHSDHNIEKNMILLTNVLTPPKVSLLCCTDRTWVSNEHESYASGSIATGGVFLARQVKGDDPD